MLSVTVDEAKLRLAELVEAAERGETIIITQSDQPVATLIAVSKTQQQPHFGSGKGSVLWMSDDFDAPLDDFREYMA